MIGDALRHQVPVQPEAVAPRLITTHHCGVCREPQPNLRANDFVRQHSHGSSRNLPASRALAHPHGESQLPRSPTQFQCQQQTRPLCSRLARTGHGQHCRAPFSNHTLGSVTAMTRSSHLHSV